VEKTWNENILPGRAASSFTSDGEQPMSLRQLLLQLGAEIVAALVAAFLLAQASGISSYMGRVGSCCC